MVFTSLGSKLGPLLIILQSFLSSIICKSPIIMCPWWWSEYLELVQWKNICSKRPSIVGVNVFYGVLIVKNFISDGIG